MATDINRLVLSLGSNCGRRAENVLKAQEWLKVILKNVVHSTIYETPPIGHSGPYYMNSVLEGDYTGDLRIFERECKAYELAHGRDEAARIKKLVPVDIDIVISGEEILRSKDYGSEFFRIGYEMIHGKS